MYKLDASEPFNFKVFSRLSVVWANVIVAILAIRITVIVGVSRTWTLCGCMGVGGTDALMLLHACSSSTLRISHLDQLVFGLCGSISKNEKSNKRHS